MPSVQKGLREGEIRKDTYGRLECAECGAQLDQRNDPDELGSVHTCPDCEREWQRMR